VAKLSGIATFHRNLAGAWFRSRAGRTRNRPASSGINRLIIQIVVVGFGLALLYLASERQLKSKRPGRLFARLPSLDLIDRAGYRLAVWGFIFLVIFDVVLTFPKDQVLTCDDVELPEGRIADQLRAEQYRHFRGETWLGEHLRTATGYRSPAAEQRA